MRPPRLLPVTLAACLSASCALILDFDELQGGEPAPVSDAAPEGSVDTLPLSQLPPKLANAVCENLKACYGPISEFVTQGEDCEVYFTATFNDTIVAQVEALIAESKLNYDPARGADCVNSLLSAAQASPPRCSDLEKFLENCKDALGPLKGPGASCGSLYECQKDTYCDASAGCPGVCTNYLSQNSPCTVTEECARGLTCFKMRELDGGVLPDAGVSTGTCQPYIKEGSACSADTPGCEPGNYCLGNTCKRVTGVFTSAEQFDCYSNGVLCQPGLACEFTGLPLISAGKCVKDELHSPCNVAFPDGCGAGNYCNYDFKPNPTCVKLPIDGQTCAAAVEQNLGFAAPCSPGLACVNGLCKPRKRLGDLCEADAQCYSGYCNSACAIPACP